MKTKNNDSWYSVYLSAEGFYVSQYTDHTAILLVVNPTNWQFLIAVGTLKACV